VQQLESVLGRVELSRAVLSKISDGEKASAPGMKYRHYAPAAKLILVKGYDKDAIAFIKAKTTACMKDERRAGVLCFDGEEEMYPNANYVASYGRWDDASTQAHRLFGALRSFDKADVEIIYARSPNESGVGLAVYNRLIKAAGYNIIVV
jgi:L-threonylcarbamoyladenylate synthase